MHDNNRCRCCVLKICKKYQVKWAAAAWKKLLHSMTACLYSFVFVLYVSLKRNYWKAPDPYFYIPYFSIIAFFWIFPQYEQFFFISTHNNNFSRLKVIKIPYLLLFVRTRGVFFNKRNFWADRINLPSCISLLNSNS